MTHGSRVVLALWIATVFGAPAMVLIVASLLAEIGEGPALALMFSVLAAVAIAYATVGLLIARRRPGNRVALVLAAGGALFVLTFSGFGIGAFRFVVHGPTDLIGGVFALIGGTALGPALFAAVPLLALLFPDGRLPGPRWRLPVVLLTAAVVASSVIGAIQPGPVNPDLPVNPIGVESDVVVALAGLGSALLLIGIFAGGVLAIAAVAVRFRRSAGQERQQVKWLLAGVTVIAVLLPASFLDSGLEDGGGFTVVDLLAFASLALFPISIGVAILRYRLYEIDRIVSRTLGWAVVTGILVAVFAGGVVLLQALLEPVTDENTLAVAASTLVAFALFQPLRRRVQRAVDRRFDRARYDGERVVATFAERLRGHVELGSLQGEIARVANDTVRPANTAVWLRNVRNDGSAQAS